MLKGGGILTSVESSSDKNFLDSVYEFIESEKKHLSCTEADEQRYIIYSAAFDMVIEHTTVYKMVLASIKREYDHFIQAVKRKHHDAQRVQARLKSTLSEPVSLINHHKRSAQLQERITVILKDTSELRTEISRLRTLQTERTSPQEHVRPFFQNPGMKGDAMMLIFIYDLHFISTFCGGRIHTEAEVVRISCLTLNIPNLSCIL
uniref:Translin-associated factor X-interacting protein 1 N-terminal domain-containing protein n=1 Tax=Paramormyrops kingsleyae TaxID=1676925 RepID=A0A3B3QFX7_9TELE